MSQTKPSSGKLGRYENPWLVAEWHREPPSGTSCTPLQLPTEDRAVAHGWLYARGGEQTVVCLMHPRANFSRHYLVPGLVEAGFAVLCINSRWLGNDSTLIHEVVLLDVAAALRAIRPRYPRVVLVGNSGGGSLYTFYLSQALAPSGARLRDLPWGEPLDLGQLERREDSAESFWRALSVLGTVGWSIALPAAAGAWLGHRLDLRFETGVRMTLILLCVGLTLGGFVAWRLVREHRS